MTENNDIFTAIGKLQSSLENVKENTDQIPEIKTHLALVADAVKTMQPKVERHQKIVWMGSGILIVFSTIWTFILATLDGAKHP